MVIVETYLAHYRVPLFVHLRNLLERDGIEFRMVHGSSDPSKTGRHDDARLPWTTLVRNLRPLGPFSSVLWQPLGRAIDGADLVIVNQENRLLHNYWLLLCRLNRPVVAFWGHGRNYQARSTLREYVRRWQVRLPDWWFAYTSSSRRAVVDAGFPEDRITVVENAVDTTMLRRDLEACSDSEVTQLRRECGIADGPVGLFCSSLHEGKRIGFLLAAARRIREQIPGFQLVVVGAGPDASLVERAASSCSWIHGVGPRFGRDKARFLRMASVFLMPAFVGLSILDAFCASLPIVVIGGPKADHSPEIDYLEDGRNGIETAPTETDYADAVVALLTDRDRLARMARAAGDDAGKYTIEVMAENFRAGIGAALLRGAKSCSHRATSA